MIVEILRSTVPPSLTIDSKASRVLPMNSTFYFSDILSFSSKFYSVILVANFFSEFFILSLNYYLLIDY